MAQTGKWGWKPFAVVMAMNVLFAGPVLAEEVKIGAGAAPTENVFNKIKTPFESATGVKLIVISNGPVQALKDLDAGTVDAASGGVTFQDWMSMMEKEGSKVADPSVYKHRVIGRDVVKVLIHKAITLSSLSRDQLKGIFTGKISNWKEVGGPDMPIVVIFGDKIPGTQSVFQKQVMDEEPYTANVVRAETAASVKEKVVSTPGAVGLGPQSVLDASVTAPQIPEVGRPITLVTRGAPSPALVKLLEFISTEGQKHIGN